MPVVKTSRMTWRPELKVRLGPATSSQVVQPPLTGTVMLPPTADPSTISWNVNGPGPAVAKRKTVL